jgi:hypothetical protein
MSKNNIHCKIELVKDPSTGQMILTAHLNPHASNITTDDHTISWTPTLEEQQFITEAISLIQKQQQKPIITFTKKTNNHKKKTIESKEDTIDSINHTIDHLLSTQNQLHHKTQHSKTIDEIINQKTKPQ